MVITEQRATQVTPELQGTAVVERPAVLARPVIPQVVAAVIEEPQEMLLAVAQAQEVLEVKEVVGRRGVLAAEAVRELRVMPGTPAALVAQGA